MVCLCVCIYIESLFENYAFFLVLPIGKHWRGELDVGYRLDARDREKKWFTAIIVDILQHQDKPLRVCMYNSSFLFVCFYFDVCRVPFHHVYVYHCPYHYCFCRVFFGLEFSPCYPSLCFLFASHCVRLGGLFLDPFRWLDCHLRRVFPSQIEKACCFWQSHVDKHNFRC
jgi:hypothetical protein